MLRNESQPEKNVVWLCLAMNVAHSY